MLLLALGLGFLAGMWMASPPSAPAAPEEAGVYVAGPGTVSQSVPGTATIRWTVVEQVEVPAEGRVTSGLPAKGQVQAGSTLFTVDEQPVLVLPGGVPAYREMRRGDVGEDVRQLQAYLADQGYPVAVTGEFGARTATAVEAWSRTVGWPRSSSLPLGRIVFVSDLPARVVPADGFRLGATIPSPAIQLLAGEPSIAVSVNPRTAERASAGDDVQLHTELGTLTGALTGASLPNQDGSVSLLVDPESVDCSQACPARQGEPYVVPATVELVAPTEGIVVPVAAITMGADGRPFVTQQDGTEQPIEVTASADGLAVVTGLAEGQRIRLGS